MEIRKVMVSHSITQEVKLGLVQFCLNIYENGHLTEKRTFFSVEKCRSEWKYKCLKIQQKNRELQIA